MEAYFDLEMKGSGEEVIVIWQKVAVPERIDWEERMIGLARTAAAKESREPFVYPW